MNFIRIGFRAIRNAPALAFAEIAWRWLFGAIAWALVWFAVRQIMTGVDVSQAEVAISRRSDAFAIADSIARILVQVLPRFVQALAVIVPLLALVWIACATIGRVAILHTLLDRCTGVSPVTPRSKFPAFVPTLILNFLRAFFSIATAIAFFGTVFFVSQRTAPDVQAGVAPLLVFGWMLFALFLGILWGAVNWFLALAPLFCMRDETTPWRAISASLALYRTETREYLAIASAFGLFRLAAMVVAILAGLVVIAAGSVWTAVALSIVIALAYFAVADYIYVARLAAYVDLASAPRVGTVSANVTPAS